MSGSTAVDVAGYSASERRDPQLRSVLRTRFYTLTVSANGML